MTQFLLLYNMGGTTIIPVVVIATDEAMARKMGENIGVAAGMPLTDVQKLGGINFSASYGKPTA